MSEALYDYDSDYARNRTSEFDADLTYNFNPVRAGAYKGLSFRERYGQRSQPAFPNFPQTFRYLRHQLQYSFSSVLQPHYRARANGRGSEP